MKAAPDLIAPLRLVLRRLVRTPVFTTIAVAIVGVALAGAALAVAFADATLFGTQTFERPEDLYRVAITRGEGEAAFRSTRVDEATMSAWHALDGAIVGVAAVQDARRGAVFFLGGREPERLAGAVVDPGYFSLLGVSPVSGRVFDDRDRARATVVISAELAYRRFGDPTAAVGHTLRLNGEDRVVIGVMPESLPLPQPRVAASPAERAQVWAAISRGARRDADHVLVRIEARASMTAAERALESAAIDAGATTPVSVRLEPLRDVILGDAPRVLALFAFTTLLALVIAAANLAALFLVRFGARAREVALRTALGARTAAILGGFFAEALLVCASGLGLGILLAAWSVDVLKAVAPPQLPGVVYLDLNAEVILWTALVAALLALAAGLVPALYAARHTAGDRSRDRGTTRAGESRARGAVIVGQVAVTVFLLYGSIVLTRSLLRLDSLAAGLPDDEIMVVDLYRPPTNDGGASNAVVYHEISRRVAELPGVRGVALTSSLPLRSRDYFAPEWRLRVVDGGYFDVMATPLIAGRTFDGRDRRDSRSVAIVNHTLARREFGADDAVGRVLDGRLIVGVVADVRHARLDEPARAAMYVPVAQRREDRLSLVVAVEDAPRAVLPVLRDAIHSIDPAQPLSNPTTFQALKNRSEGVSHRRFQAGVFLVLGGFAMLLAALGVYGMAAQFALDRRREFGVRLALGATPASVVRFVLARVAVLGGLGLAVGVIGAAATSTVLRGLVFGVPAADPASFVGSTALVLAITVAAGLVPARRAARLDVRTLVRVE